MKRSTHGGRSEISEQGVKRRIEKVSNGWPKRSLARSVPLSYALKPYPWYNKICHTRLQSVRSITLFGTIEWKATERSEGASYTLKPY